MSLKNGNTKGRMNVENRLDKEFLYFKGVLHAFQECSEQAYCTCSRSKGNFTLNKFRQVSTLKRNASKKKVDF